MSARAEAELGQDVLDLTVGSSLRNNHIGGDLRVTEAIVMTRDGYQSGLIQTSAWHRPAQWSDAVAARSARCNSRPFSDVRFHLQQKAKVLVLERVFE
jgi:hypothetical protein